MEIMVDLNQGWRMPGDTSPPLDAESVDASPHGSGSPRLLARGAARGRRRRRPRPPPRPGGLRVPAARWRARRPSSTPTSRRDSLDVSSPTPCWRWGSSAPGSWPSGCSRAALVHSAYLDERHRPARQSPARRRGRRRPLPRVPVRPAGLDARAARLHALRARVAGCRGPPGRTRPPRPRLRAGRGRSRALRGWLSDADLRRPPALPAAPFVEALRSRREPPCLAGSTLELREGSFPFDERTTTSASGSHGSTRTAPTSPSSRSRPQWRPRLPRAQRRLPRGHPGGARGRRGRFRALASGVCLEDFSGACVSAQAVVAGLGDLPGELARSGQVLFVHPGPPAGRPDGSAGVVGAGRRLHGPDAGGVLRLARRRRRATPGARCRLRRPRRGRPDPTRAPALAGSRSRRRAVRVHLDTASYGSRALRLCADPSAPTGWCSERRPRHRRRTDAASPHRPGRSCRVLARSATPARLFP